VVGVNWYRTSALKLYNYLIRTHWNGEALVGPDPIGKIHWRVTRFVRSYLPWLPGDDRYIYLQGQAYWIRANWRLLRQTGNHRYREIIRRCADYIVHSQPEDGAWRHPPIWGRRGFISTVEGVWACLGLMKAHEVIGDASYLEAVRRWLEVQIHTIGFQTVGEGWAVNYYAHSNSKVPNVTTMTIWLFGEMITKTGETAYVPYLDRMLRFIQDSQMDNGELPYALGARPHFMCYQYNAFEFLDLASFFELTQDERVYPILKRQAAFLQGGLTGRGSCRYNCFKETPEVHYWTAALAAALRKASELGLGNYEALSERAYRYLLGHQQPDGRFYFSEHNYRFLRDRRSYPRYLAMLLEHLLYRASGVRQ